ncbi:signal peptidase I [Arthrobacter rhombi]|uniref:signal peptidase I n=1 Tax=Arthrobacter rhombi TaxID=71253 RepID=UPI002652DEF5|nr:signal peptidase I [Micrococcaceae bacterium]
MGALMVAAIAAIIVRGTLVDFYYIGSDSMETTLEPGEGLLVNRTAYHQDPPQRGDVLVFDGRGSLLPYQRASPLDDVLRALRVSGDDTAFVKRVIAVGGDTLSCCDKDGRLLLNGEPLHEPYLFAGDAASEQEFTAVVPEGRIWVMGDHRSVSADSRSLLGAPGGGMIPEERVIGRVERVIWPMGAARHIEGKAPRE